MKKIIYILLIFLIISISLNIHYYNNDKTTYKEVIVEKRDTIFQTKFKTDTIYFKDTQYKYITVNDTLYIESKNKEYKDSTEDYDITINAVKLNSYQLNIHKVDTAQYENKIIKETIIQKEKQNPFGISLFLGPAYDVYNKQMGISVGIGVSFRIK